MKRVLVLALLLTAPQALIAAILVPPVLVLPAENRTGKLDYEWIGTSVARYLSSKLLPMLDVAVISPERQAAAFESIDIPASRALTRATMIRLSGELKASFVIFGSYELRGDGDLQVTVTMLDDLHMTMGKSIAVKGKLNELISIENTIGYSVVREYFADAERLRTQILSRDISIPFDAYEYFIKSFAVGDPAKRLSYLQKAIALYPAYGEAVLEEAEILYARGDAAAVIKLLANPSPEYADQYGFLRGMAYFSMRDFPHAATAFTALVGKPALSEAALNNLAASCSENGGQDQAAFYLKRALPLASAASTLYFNLGVVNERAGQLDAAIAGFKEVARRNPADWQAQVLLADILTQRGLKEEAQAIEAVAAQRASAQHIPSPAELLKTRLLPLPEATDTFVGETPPAASRAEVIGFHLSRGTAYCEKEMWVEATDELRRVLYLDPYDGQARYLLARSYLELGDLNRALTEAKMSLWSDETPSAHILLSRILTQLGRKEEAQAEAQRALKIDPNNAEARALAGV